MSGLKIKPKLFEEIGAYALTMSDKAVAISSLYISYCDTIGKPNKDLYKYALNKISNNGLGDIVTKQIKDKTKKYNAESFKVNALDFATQHFFGDGHFKNSNFYLSELVAELLEINNTDIVFDFGSGTGAFLAYIACALDDSLIRHELRGTEINTEDVYLSRMVLEMCGSKYTILNQDILAANADSKFNSFDKGYVFPPIGLKIKGQNANLNKYKDLINSRTSSEWLFVLKAMEGMKEKGKILALLPESVLFKASDTSIRKYLLENKLIEGIISLPANAFIQSPTKFSIVILSENNESFKYVDGESVLNDLPGKGLNSDEASNDLYIAYNVKDVRKYSINNVESIHYNLALSSINNEKDNKGLPELDMVADVIRGSNMTLANFKDELYEGESEYQILTSSDIGENGFINFAKLAYIGGDKKYDKFTLQKDDVVITSKSTRVKVAVIDSEPQKKIVVTGGMIIIRPHKDKLDGTFLKIYLSSNKGRKTLSYIQKGSTIVTISFENLLKIKLDLPPLDKQREIANHYKIMNSKYESAKRELDIMEKEMVNYVNRNIK